MKRRSFLAAGLVLPGALHGLTRASRPVDDRFDELARLVEERMRAHGIPGAALGVVKDGQLVMRGFGVTSVEDPQLVTPDTVFELASLSKTVTATAAMQLVEQGKLDLDAPIRRYLPNFNVKDEAATAAITTRHLLTHSSGFEATFALDDLGRESLARWSETTGDLIQLSPPGRVWSYSNPGYGLAGRIIEVVSGLDVRDAFRALVFEPLGLERASARLEEVATWPMTLGHRPGPNGAAVVVRPYSMGSSVPSGGVNMSLTSLMRYAAFHLGEHDGGAGAITRATRTAMRVEQLRKEPTGEGMAIGWHVRAVGGVLTAAHGGTAGAGHRCHLQIVPDRRLGFAILTNHTEGWRLLQDVERAALAAYEGLALAPNQPICGYRGHTETLDHVAALPVQPPSGAYLGRYRRSADASTEVREDSGGRLLVGAGERAEPILFHGPDIAFGAGQSNRGINYDFIRDGAQVRWLRVSGQIARKESG